MFDLARTEELRGDAMRLLKQHELEYAQNPSSFACRIMVNSSIIRVEELTKRIIEEKTKRENELIEIRLVGELAQNGSLPLNALGQLSLSIEETLIEVGKFARFGSKKKKNAHSQTRTELQPTLKRLGVGSTRMFVQVNTVPDMFGNSLSEVCISRTFGILSATDSDELIEKTANVGQFALRTLNRFLKSLLDYNLEVSFNWLTPLDTELTWKGDRIRIQQLQSSIDSITQTEPFEIAVEGELVTQSIKGDGKFELLTDRGFTINGTVPTYVLGQFVQVCIGSYCQCKVLQSIRENKHTGKTFNFYELTYIESLPNYLSAKDLQLKLF